MENLTKEQYIETKRKLLVQGVDDNAFKLFYDYWQRNRLPEYFDIRYDEFVNTFSTYLQHNYNAVLNTVLPFYDKEYGVTKVMKISDNSVLTEF